MAARRHRSENEEEVKIKLSRSDLEKVFNALSKKYEPEEIEHKYMPRDYWDTRRFDLDRNNISVRTQYKEGTDGEIGGHEQTVKLDLTHGNTLAKGAILRREVKNIMPDYKPDLSAVTDAKTKLALKPFMKKKLNHPFTAAIERRYFKVEVGHGRHKGTVEIAFDVGDFILQHNERRRPLSEIELEKKAGSKDAIDKLREQIMDIAPSAEIQPLSKSQQGSRFCRQSISARHKNKHKFPAAPRSASP
jgi:inorganic triphosphatase YgiF